MSAHLLLYSKVSPMEVWSARKPYQSEKGSSASSLMDDDEVWEKFYELFDAGSVLHMGDAMNRNGGGKFRCYCFTALIAPYHHSRQETKV